MFNNLSDKLDKALHTLKGHGKITEVNVAETLKEVRRALLDADVNFKIAKEFTKRVQEKALGQDVLTTLNPGQLMVKLVKDELAELMGGETVGINLGGSPTIILMSGLQGSGKTTFSGKLANYLKTKKSKDVLLVGCDVYRPAAINQLQVVGEQIGVAFQLADDIVDITSISEQSGKIPGTDLREGIPTLAGLIALTQENPENAQLRELLSRPLPDPAEHAVALELLRNHSSLNEARLEACRWADEARRTLEPLPEITAKETLIALCDYVVTRTG